MIEQKKGSSNAAYFLAGAVIAGVVSLLYSTKSGRETREQLGNWLRERREQGAKLVDRTKEKIDDVVETGKQTFYESGKYSS